MRLTDIAQAVAQHGAEKYIEKKALRAFGVGTTLPGTFRQMEERYRDTRRKLDQASLQTLDSSVAKTADWTQFLQGMTGASPRENKTDRSGNPVTYTNPSASQMGGALAGPAITSFLGPLLGAPGKAIGAHIEKYLGPRKEFGEAKDLPHMFGNAAVGAFGKEVGAMGAGLLRDIANKAMSSIGNVGNEAARTAILQQLRREDPVLQEADDKVLMEAYHTMTRFAPVLSTDKNAVRSFLRQAVMSGNGPDYMSIKLLADSERAVTGEKKE